MTQLESLLIRKKIIKLKDATNIVWKVSNNFNAEVTLAGNRTLELQGLEEGDYGTLKIIQDGVGISFPIVGFNTGNTTGLDKDTTWGNNLITPNVVTKEQPTIWNIGAYIQ